MIGVPYSLHSSGLGKHEMWRAVEEITARGSSAKVWKVRQSWVECTHRYDPAFLYSVWEHPEIPGAQVIHCEPENFNDWPWNGGQVHHAGNPDPRW